MRFDNSIQLQALYKEAAREYDTLEDRVNTVSEELYKRVGGNSRGSLVGGYIFAGLWMVLYLVLSAFASGIVKLVMLIACLLLVGAMMMDTSVRLKYYGQILKYKERLTRLLERIQFARNNLRMNEDEFRKAGARGWNLPLSLGTSIPEESDSIAVSLAQMESLRTGFLHNVKNLLYYAVGLCITAAGGLYLIPVLDDVVYKCFGEDGFTKIYHVGIAVSMVLQFFVARFIWAETDCEVRNRTLFGTLTGPVVFVLTAAVVVLAVFAVVIVLYVGGFLLALFCAWSCLCGG